MMKKTYSVLLLLFVLIQAGAQIFHDTALWHDKERFIRYHPEGTDFVITNGERRFTRALYGTNTAFRIEAGDLPEFALYMPGMGGNIKFGLWNGDNSKWLIEADSIKAIYRPGSMIYTIGDKMLGNGKLQLVVLALSGAEGLIFQLQFENIPTAVKLVWAYGGASGKKFSRDGDMGPDPESSFYLQPGNCMDNRYSISGNDFLLKYGTGVVAEWDPYVNKNFASDTVKPARIGKEQRIGGFVPPAMNLKVADAAMQSSPLTLYQSVRSATPVITGLLPLRNREPYYFLLQKADSAVSPSYREASQIFNAAEIARKKIAERIKLFTPDKYINTLGAALGIAADAVWEHPTFLHGSIGWRIRLNGWRGPYVGDVLSWHERSRTHFRAYALSQLTSPATGPVVMDTALHLARSLEKLGTSIFSSGYICRNPNGDFRPHHYDMNLVYIDALFRHFKWTGDLVFAKEIWSVITRHFAWEKRNFDPDDDGLYDAYAAIWASDALQYSGGSVTHSSAYNYKANKEAALLAALIGEDPSPFEKEAVKILNAINRVLWIPSKGSYAEFKDLMGNKLLHEHAAVWSLYHAVDSDVPDPFQAYQCMRYIDNNIPHIPVKAEGLEKGFYTISTSKWMPYDWSLNNVATAEVMHTALANWQAGRNEKGFNLFKSELLSTMYLGGSPGNIGQISFYDAARGEAYRDFADPVAMTARCLVEGLFGIQPDALKGELVIKPGFPSSWNHATLSIPDITIDFRRKAMVDSYIIRQAFPKKMFLKLVLRTNSSGIESILVNGMKVSWKNNKGAIGSPLIEINAGLQSDYTIKITWKGKKTKLVGAKEKYVKGSALSVQFPGALIQEVFDPGKILQHPACDKDHLTSIVQTNNGHHTVFALLKQNDFSWWEPLDFEIKEAVEVKQGLTQVRNQLHFSIVNNSDSLVTVTLFINKDSIGLPGTSEIEPGHTMVANAGSDKLIPGTNTLLLTGNCPETKGFITNWNIDRKLRKLDAIELTGYFNDKVSNIFRNQYFSPRPTVATLQLPTQGIGDWTHPLKTADINDKGLRKLAGDKNEISLPQGIRFSTPSDTLKPNILFTSQWDNYPKKVVIPLSGKALHAYFLMAGSTNPMQSRIVNGAVIIRYTDNSTDTLLLRNPETWWPIEQDYLDDGFAFRIDAARPVRVHLKTGRIVSDYDNSIAAYNGKMIDGGAATVLDLPLNPVKKLKELELQTIANDVVIGLMALTLLRE